ncbi:helix-turn-helix transcriptional regulator [Oscillatoria laete-virens NRMC-F 0139]|nr:AraC family transcriptional regulator [Oscillatoria laete-virens]MDL5055072.1 helix-turn-helix transcriptional regulator [Oscillatoria laete-virens NRMC-F 0139]
MPIKLMSQSKSRLIELKKQFPSLQTIGVAAEYFPGYEHPQREWLAHDIVYVSLVVRGRTEHIIGERRFHEREGGMSVVHEGQWHYFDTVHGPIDVINLYLDPYRFPFPRVTPALDRVIHELFPPSNRLPHRINQIVHLQFPKGYAVAAPLLEIVRECRSREEGAGDLVLAHLKIFLTLCGRHVLKEGLVAEEVALPAHLRRLEDFRRSLDAQFAREFRLGDWARKLRVDKSHLCRAFKDYTGKSPLNYLVNRRVQEAMLRLRSGDDKITVIAQECGFSDIGYFNRVFRRITGMSPRGYRTLNLRPESVN